jgi:hypothetical protein
MSEVMMPDKPNHDRTEDEILFEIYENIDDVKIFNSGNVIGQELLSAVQEGDLEGVKKLMSLPVAGGGLIFLRLVAKDADGSNALHLAAARGHKEIAAFLMEQGLASMNMKNSGGKTPKDLAAENNNEEILDLMTSFEQKIRSAG